MHQAVKQTENWKNIQAIRKKFCPGIKCGVSSQFGGSTFAEMRDGGLQNIMDVLVSTGILVRSSQTPPPKLVAIDIGAGLGKFLFFLASACLELGIQTKVEMRGIEINTSSFQQAVATANVAQKLFPKTFSFQFSCIDAKKIEPGFLDDVHIMYAFNRAVPQEVFRHVCSVCNTSPCLEIIFSSLKLHQLGLSAKKFQKSKQKLRIVAEGGKTSSVIRVYLKNKN